MQLEIEEAAERIAPLASEAEQESAAGVEVHEPIDMRMLAKKAVEATVAAELVKKRLDEERSSLEAQTLSVSEEAQRTADDRSELKTERDRLAAEWDALNEQRARLVDLKAEAEAGFIAEQLKRRSDFETKIQEILADLTERGEALVSTQSTRELEHLERWQQLESDWRKRSEQLEAEFDQRTAYLTQLEIVTKAEAATVTRETLRLTAREAILAEDTSSLSELVRQSAIAELAKKDAELEALRKCCASLEEDLTGARESERRLGDRTAEDVFAEISALHDEQRRLRNHLATKLDDEATERLASLEREHESWQAERAALMQENADLRFRSDRAVIAVTELETLRDQKSALETARDILHRTLEDLRGSVDEARGSAQESTFPACAKMDGDSDFQSEIQLTENLQLGPFSKYVRDRIAYDDGLFYSERDTRSFLAGLAMSRLHLLQGISGTGKTSLPQAFARAVGAKCATIEVQAGWRERHDLLGHYNSFDKRFYETEFLKALYQAQLPLYRDRPFIVLLDEMNLSHPEQYFADFISLLEQPQDEDRVVALLGEEVLAPDLMRVKNGTYLPLPRNVWFVGTANHDETTKDFADKTYDRSHVMELPRHHVAHKARQQAHAEPIALAALDNAFASARAKHEGAASQALAWLDTEFADVLAERFRIGWSNRLGRQISSYVPVILECGGSLGEAMDQLVAMKLLRKLRDRHDNRLEDLSELTKQVETAFKELDAKWMGDVEKGTELLRCRQLLLDERRRLSPTGDID